MARRTGRANPMTAKAGVTKTKRRYACGERGSSIAHESEHIKNAIWRYIGYEPQRDNDEVDAYLLTYIYTIR